MNIFVLDEDPRVSAEMVCDKHVVKMIIESAQMLSTVHRYVDGDEFISYTKAGRKIKRWAHYTDDMKSPIRLHKSGAFCSGFRALTKSSILSWRAKTGPLCGYQ